MHVLGFNFDFHPFFQYLFTCVAILIVILQLVKTTASNYFSVDANFEEQSEERGRRQEALRLNANSAKNRDKMVAAVADSGDGICAVCGGAGEKRCSRCKKVRYCSLTCQSKHWKEGHKLKCQELKLSAVEKASVCNSKSSIDRSLLKKVLFSYEDFMNLFNWEDEGCSPCGLLNCGNSCYANVVLQCLSCTRPLVAYLLKIGHARKCRRNDWCFLCELEAYVKRTRQNMRPFSPIHILSRLPNIGGNLGYGKQEDAHEFMRFAIDTMQSVCLDEFGGEKALHPTSQETTLIQYIFGGHLKSQVKCSKCNKISYRHENMMDLTVEIQGDAESLEECLDQFTSEEWLDGENMYKCDGCNDYVKACKRLAVHHAPNILTIALKRFQSGRFGKLNKRVTFPETLDLGPYMSEPENGTDVYRLYAVVVHIDMLNASYFGHYICYTKDFCGNWYRIDDCKVTKVDLDEVLAQGAYMLLYSRISVRPSSAKLEETPEEKKEKVDEVKEAEPCLQAAVESVTVTNLPSVVSSVADKEQNGVVVVEKGQPSLLLPVEPIIVEGPTKSLSTMHPSTKEDDSASMNLDEPLEVNAKFVKVDVAAATDVSSVADVQEQETDAVDKNQPCILQPFEPIIGEASTKSLSTMHPSSGEDDSLCMNLDDLLDVDSIYQREDLAATTADVPGILKPCLLHMDVDCMDGSNLLYTRAEQMDHGLDNPDSSLSGMEIDNHGLKYLGAIGGASSVGDSHGEITLIPLSGASPSVEIHNLNSEESGTGSYDHNFVSGNTRTGDKESISNGIPLDNEFRRENDTDNLADISYKSPDLHPAEKTLEGDSSISPADAILEPVDAIKSVSVFPAARIATESIPGSVDKPYSNGEQMPLSRGFLNEHAKYEFPNGHGDVLIQSDEVGPCKVSSSCNGFARAGVFPNDNAVLDSDEMFHSNGQHTPSPLNSKPGKWSNQAEPGGDYASVSSEVAEAAFPVRCASSVSISASSTDSSLQIAAYDLGISPKGLEINAVHTRENGNSCTKSVCSLPGPINNGMNATFVPSASSSSDIEMIDMETDHSNGRQSRGCPISVQASSGSGMCSIGKSPAVAANLKSGKSSSRRSSPVFSSGFLDKKKTPKFKHRNDASEDLSDVKSSGNFNNSNSSTNHTSVLRSSRQATNHDRNRNHDDLCRIEDQAVKMEEDEMTENTLGGAGEPRQSHCNGDGYYGKVDKNKTSGSPCSNGKQPFARGFLNQPTRKTCMKKDKEGPGSVETVSPMPERKKLPRVG